MAGAPAEQEDGAEVKASGASHRSSASGGKTD